MMRVEIEPDLLRVGVPFGGLHRCLGYAGLLEILKDLKNERYA